MKVKSIVLILLFLMSPLTIATVVEDYLSVDFLEFLADMDEITGEGFDIWLEEMPEDKAEPVVDHRMIAEPEYEIAKGKEK